MIIRLIWICPGGPGWKRHRPQGLLPVKSAWVPLSSLIFWLTAIHNTSYMSNAAHGVSDPIEQFIWGIRHSISQILLKYNFSFFKTLNNPVAYSTIIIYFSHIMGLQISLDSADLCFRCLLVLRHNMDWKGSSYLDILFSRQIVSKRLN